MARVQVYLPDDLHAAAKGADLPISRLTQEALRSALRRRELDAESDRYEADLAAEVGLPTEEDRATVRRAWEGRLRPGRRSAAEEPGQLDVA